MIQWHLWNIQILWMMFTTILMIIIDNSDNTDDLKS